MRRLLFPLTLVAAALVAGGCATQAYDGRVYRPHERVYRADRRADVHYDRVYRDVRYFTEYLDRELRLSPRQRRQIEDRLAARTFAFLDRVPPGRRDHVYPFPRREARRDRALRDWWEGADRDVRAHLSRNQQRRYRQLVGDYDRGRGYQDDRGRGKKRGHGRRGRY